MGTEKSVETREQELERVVQSLVSTLRHMAGAQDTAYEEARWDRHEVKRELERAADWGESILKREPSPSRPPLSARESCLEL